MSFKYNPFTDNIDNVGLANPVCYIDFKTDVDIAIQEGRMTWDSENGTVVIGMPGGDVAIQVGQEVVLPNRPKNDQGAQINNGQVVYVSGATGSVPEVKLANASLTTAPKTIAVATEDVLNNQRGYFTTFGAVREIDTSSFNEGDELFLDATDGGLTTDKLNHPNFRIRIGYCLRSHATEGVIFVAIEPDQWLKRFQSMLEPTGFDESQPDLRGDISFVNGTRTFSIAPKAGQDYFNFWISGREFRKQSQIDLIITDVEGEHYIYFDTNGDIQEAVNPSDASIDTLIREAVLIAYIRWDATNGSYVWFNNERHLNRMDGNHHSYHHFIDRTRWVSGGALDNFDIGETTLDSGAQFGITSGTIADEDIVSVESAIASTTGNEIIYKDGATGIWRRITESGFSVLTDTTAGVGVTGRLVWNEFTGGAWQLTTVSSNRYVLCHIIQTNGENTGERYFSIVGQNQYNSLIDARAGAVVEKDTLVLSGLAGPEFIFLGTVIFQTRDSYSNSVKATVRQTDSLDDYIDWRGSPSTPGGGAGNHSTLGSLIWTDSNHTGTPDRFAYFDATGAASYLSQDELLAQSASPGFSLGKAGTINPGAWYLRPGAVPSNKSGLPISLYNASLKTVTYASGAVQTYDVEIWEHSGNLTAATLVTTLNIVASQSGTISLDVPLTTGKQLAAKLTTGLASDGAIDIQMSGSPTA